MRPFKKGKMRGYKQPAHCACGVPHASDHSSPAHRQSYDAPQRLLLSASVGMRLSTKEKAFCQTAPEGSPDFAEELTRESQQWLGKGDVLNLLGICSLIATDRQIHATCPPGPHISISLLPVSAVWSAPLGVDRYEAVQLAICRACSSSKLTGLLYPSAEWRRLAL